MGTGLRFRGWTVGTWYGCAVHLKTVRMVTWMFYFIAREHKSPRQRLSGCSLRPFGSL